MEREGREHKPLVNKIEGDFEETRTCGPTRAPGKGRDRARRTVRRTILVVAASRSTLPAAGGTLVGAGGGAAGGAIYDMTRCER
jgi:hypothetical protein